MVKFKCKMTRKELLALGDILIMAVGLLKGDQDQQETWNTARKGLSRCERIK